jgi:AcrR family transcriptional regulator
VDSLAKELGIARSGFYWHFRDRADFHNQLLKYWAYEYSEVVMKNPQIQKGEPRERLLKIIHMVKDLDLNSHDAAVLTWADQDLRARKAFDRVYAGRCEFLRPIFSELGFEGDDLETRTRIFVSYVSWENRLFPRASKRKRLEWLKKQVEILIRK